MACITTEQGFDVQDKVLPPTEVIPKAFNAAGDAAARCMTWMAHGCMQSM